MKTVAPHDRPREKLERIGAGALGDNELLAIVIGHGVANATTSCTPGHDRCRLSNSLSRFRA